LIDPDLIIAQAESLQLFKLIGGAADAAALVGTGQALGDGPNAYVLPTVDDPQPPRGLGAPQPVTSTFGLLIMLRRHGDPTGALGMAQIKILQRRLHAGFLGWKAPDCQPCYWRGGRLLHFDKSSLWWLEEFACVTTVVPTLRP
jgi:hypothetical protein